MVDSNKITLYYNVYRNQPQRVLFATISVPHLSFNALQASPLLIPLSSVEPKFNKVLRRQINGYHLRIAGDDDLSPNLSSTTQSISKREQCVACLYTGVGTCTALSLYFFKLALLDAPESPKELVKTHKDQRFMLAFGTCWAMAGVYRLYLG